MSQWSEVGRRKRISSGGTMDPNVGADIAGDELEFIQAMERFRRTVVKFPTCQDVLRIVHALGYRRVAPAVPIPTHPATCTRSPQES